jgi:hypothetical protein
LWWPEVVGVEVKPTLIHLVAAEVRAAQVKPQHLQLLRDQHLPSLSALAVQAAQTPSVHPALIQCFRPSHQLAVVVVAVLVRVLVLSVRMVALVAEMVLPLLLSLRLPQPERAFPVRVLPVASLDQRKQQQILAQAVVVVRGLLVLPVLLPVTAVRAARGFAPRLPDSAFSMPVAAAVVASTLMA